MTEWGWKPKSALGLWRHGAEWLRPVIAAVPYLTVILLLVMMWFVGGTMTLAKGVLFDLPDPGSDEGTKTELVALVMPVDHDTLVLFDDSRYLLSDVKSMRSFAAHLAASADRSETRTLLVLVDRRVSCGELTKFAALARQGGVTRMLFAEKHEEAEE